MKTLVITDLHLNPRRQGGTTLESREALENWQFEKFEEILSIPHDLLVINGDLFDKRSVSEKTLLRTYNLLKDEDVVLNRGNHDANSMKYGEICSLELLAGLLPMNSLVFDKPDSDGEFYWIPHCFDQAQFDEYVLNVDKNTTVFIHANYDNFFAVEADHSLNFSSKQLKHLRELDCTVILGHEHAHSVNSNNDLITLGCSIPTSIADCLGGSKFVMTIDEGSVDYHKVWDVEEDYFECDISNINVTSHKFVRVNGECGIAEYPEVVRNIAELRRKSDAFIIANNVKVKVSDTETLTAEEVTNFNILELLLERIDPEFKEDVKVCI